MSAIAARDESAGRRRPRYRGWRLFAVAAFLACVLLVLIRNFFFEIYLIPSESMEPLLDPGDRIIVNRTLDRAERGDVVVFDGEGSFSAYRSTSPWLSHPLRTTGQWLGLVGSDTVYVKRVIGIAGDTVACCSNGRLTVNGTEIDENYLYPGDASSNTEFSVTVPEGRIWVMGDHRSVSRDSRALLGAPGGGMVRVDRIIGQPVAIVWPYTRWASLEIYSQ